ncbi:hypothetical protein JP09_008755 [Dehalogenimonas etheniformans]|uniref:Uncharacterized protein n=1 Tax=Dehalogenimonas etheniformans TaxID=1536648 RepID=A0A2P5P688_9CHLR|nr:hypothetical protein JP09_008755 [Dehalogenimonas etheniformans]
MNQQDPRSRRRVRFSLIVIISQALLIALAVAWGIYLIAISANGGSIISTETNKTILWGEIIATGLIIIFSIVVIVMELNRLFARRRDDRRIS